MADHWNSSVVNKTALWWGKLPSTDSFPKCPPNSHVAKAGSQGLKYSS